MRRFILVGSSVLGLGCVIVGAWAFYLGKYDLMVINLVMLAVNTFTFFNAKRNIPLKGPTRW